MSDGYQAWLVEIATGRLVAGPIGVEIRMDNSFFAGEPLILKGRGPIACHLCISRGEQSIFEDPSRLYIREGDEVWVGRNQAGDYEMRDGEPYLWSVHYGQHSQWMSAKPALVTPTSTTTFGVPISESKGTSRAREL